MGYELSKTKYTAPLDMIPVTQAKKAQAIASNVDYRHYLHDYSYPPDSINMELAKKSYALQSDVSSYAFACMAVLPGFVSVASAEKF